MSLVCPTGSYVEQTSGLIPFTSDGTWMFWWKPLSVAPALSQQIPFLRANAGETVVAGIFSDLDGSPGWGLAVTNDGVTIHLVDGQGFEVDRWMHVAYVKSGNTHSLYKNGQFMGSVSVNVSAGTITRQNAGGDSHPATVGDHELYGFKQWDDNLSQAEVQYEMNATTPWQQLSDLYSYSLFDSNLLDQSGNGHDWTAVGSPTFGTSLAIPSAAIPAGAIDITGALPYSDATDLAVAGAIAFDRWYQRTAQNGEEVWGGWGFGVLTGEADPTTSTWTGGGATSYLNINADNVPFQMPVVQGTTYYFRVRPDTDDRTSPSFPLTFSLLPSPQETVPLGSIAVNDDSEGFPLTLLSSVDGDDFHVLDFVTPFPSGEAADVLDDGTVLVHDNANQRMVGFNASYVQQFSLSGYVDPSALGIVRTCRGTQRFWVLNEPGADILARYITSAGVEGPAHTLGVGSTVRAQTLCVANDESVLYFSVGGGPNNGKIQAFDLLTDTLMGDFAAAQSGYLISDLLCLSDGSIVALYSNSTTDHVQLIQYNAAGAILATVDLGSDNQFPSGTPPRAAYSMDDPNTVWVWQHPASTPFVSLFREIRLSDGSTVRAVQSQEYEGGEYFADATSDPVRFGNSFSCPFWVATQGFTPPGPEPPTPFTPSDGCPPAWETPVPTPSQCAPEWPV